MLLAFESGRHPHDCPAEEPDFVCAAWRAGAGGRDPPSGQATAGGGRATRPVSRRGPGRARARPGGGSRAGAHPATHAGGKDRVDPGRLRQVSIPRRGPRPF